MKITSFKSRICLKKTVRRKKTPIPKKLVKNKKTRLEKKSKSRQNVNATDITLKLLVHPLKPLSVNSPQLPSGNLVLRFKEREDFGLEASILS